MIFKKLLSCLMVLGVAGQASASPDQYQEVGQFALPFMKKLYLFSEVSGVVTFHGKPVEGVQVEQYYYYHWGDERGTKTTTTDQNGRYSFPAIVTRSGTATLLPHEEITDQRINFLYEGKSHRGWMYSKHNFNNMGELKRPLRLKCDLADEEQAHVEIANYGICVEDTN